MPRGKKNTNKPTIPELPWSENNHALTWRLLDEIAKTANYKVLYGKKTKDENTSGETKVTVYRRIAAVLFLELYQQDMNTMGDRIKSKLESLTKAYRKHAVRLRRTGDGVGNPDDDDKGADSPVEGQESVQAFRISGSGPDDSTPEADLNIWKQIEAVFPFFPVLHRIFATRPNVVPICATTALRPRGRETVWYQPPTATPPQPITDDLIDPVLRTAQASPPASPPPRSFGDDITDVVNTAPPASQPVPNTEKNVRPAKPSSYSQEAIQKVRENLTKVSGKRTIGETLHEMQMNTFALMRQETAQKLLIAKQGHLLEEVRLGIRTPEAYLAEMKKLEEQDMFDTPGPSKRQRTQAPSPDWDLTNFDSD